MGFAISARYSSLLALYTVCASTLSGPAFAGEPDIHLSERGKTTLSLSMEDDFVDVPSEFVAALTKSGANKDYLDSECKKYVGRTIPASTNKQSSVWLITTPGCGWGAHTAPIWVVEKLPEGERLLFSGGGIGFDLLGKAQYGYQDIVISDSSAGYYGDAHYKFNGKKYIKFASRFAMMTDPDACKILPDILECN